jgi:dTMP kinase
MFITFEGLDGSGKTTQIAQVSAQLRAKGYPVLTTREPGGTLIGDQIRTILNDMKHKNMSPRAELLLFCASRAQIVDEVLRPWLADGGIILCDRFADSTIAYQGYGHGLDIDKLLTIVQFATGGLRPDLTLYLDVPAEISLRRRMNASLFGEEFNRLDDMELAFYQRVEQGYRDLMRAEPERWISIDATKTPEKVQTAIMKTLNKRLKMKA